MQYAPGLFRHLKIAIDRERHSTGRFILTGSQKFNLMKAVSDSLAGRCAILELDKAALAREVGVSSKAANDWLSVLEASNQVQLLEPYFENLGKRLIKSPKLYLSDTGLLCFLLGLDERSLPQTPYLGAIWESAVYAQLRKQRDRAGEGQRLLFGGAMAPAKWIARAAARS